MRVNRRVVPLGVLVLVLAVYPGVAAAKSTTTLHLGLKGTYACKGSCATATHFTARGSGGRFNFSLTGTVLKTNSQGCLVQKETWTLTAGKKNALFLSTTSDTLCPTANSNVSSEAAAFSITGGSGRFHGATGNGTFGFSVLVSPQVASGALTATVTV
jgi:hypothetical protein